MQIIHIHTGNGLRLTLTVSNTWIFIKRNVLRLSSKYLWRMAEPFKSTLHLETNLTKYAGQFLDNILALLISWTSSANVEECCEQLHVTAQVVHHQLTTWFTVHSHSLHFHYTSTNVYYNCRLVIFLWSKSCFFELWNTLKK